MEHLNLEKCTPSV